MEIVAKVFDWNITKTELDFEEYIIRKQFPNADSSEIRAYAINQLIDRYLLMQEAINKGINVDDDELENALLDMLDDVDAPEISVLLNRFDRGEQIERILKSNLIIKKYIDTYSNVNKYLDENKLLDFYQERLDYFCKEEEVRASHILIKGTDKRALEKITKIRECIHNAEDFASISTINSECPSGVNCGDLGFFPKGRMDSNIEKVAFSLQVNEISQPFKSKYGYHILMVTDRRSKQSIPFEQIKDCLKESLKDIEEEVEISRILAVVRDKCQDAVMIYNHAFE